MPNRPGFMDEIRCDEKDYLIWKWRPAGRSNREDAIRWGSSLRVRDGSVAVFVYRKRNQEAVQEFIEGPFDKTLETSNLPVISSFVAAAYGGGTPFQAEVYFINLAKVIQTRFAVRYFDVFDPRFMDFGVPVAVRGTITFKIADYHEFISLHRLDEFSLEDLRAQIKDAVSRRVKSIVGAAPATQGIPLQQLAWKTDEISTLSYDALAQPLRETYGIEVASIDIDAIEVDKESAGYRSLAAVTQEVTAATVRAQTEANIKNIQETQRIQMENLAETLRIEREESQYAIHKGTQSGNLPAYQIEAQAAVGMAGAEALGHLGDNGSGNVDLGGGGFNLAGLAAGMALGGAVGKNVAATFGNVTSGLGQKSAASQDAGVPTPPPIPASKYFVAINGTATGPFDMDALSSMANAGSLAADTLIWQEGMPEWSKAGSITEVAALFSQPSTQTPPPIPEQ